METKHTQGPWRMLPPSTGVDANWHVTDSDDTFVAHVYGFSHSVDEASKANARLIAAAPDLLEALQELAGLVTTAPQQYIDAANAAIAKAIGHDG